MVGFFGAYNESAPSPAAVLPADVVRRDFTDRPFCLTQVTLNKFLNDKLFLDNGRYFYALEGVLFDGQSALWTTWHQQEGLAFLPRLRGSFAGIIYDKQEQELIIFNDQIGSKLLYYAVTDKGLVFASDLAALRDRLPSPQPDLDYIHELLDVSYVSSDRSLVAGVRRLCAGSYLRCRGKKVEVCTYYHLTPRKTENRPVETIVTDIDRLFRNAVRRVIEKNEQEGLTHYFPLSGGLDSRMAVWVAKQLIHQPIAIFNYAQSGHYDHTVSKFIADYLGCTHEFMPLDNGDYLSEIDEIGADSSYSIDYNGPSEMHTFLKRSHDWNRTGVVLTGVSGDIVLTASNKRPQYIERIYREGFSCNLHVTPLMLQTVTESYSPYTDIDLMEYLLGIDHRLLYNYRLYDRWILSCYPEAAQWHHEHQTIGQRQKMIFVAQRYIPLKDVPRRMAMYLLRHLRIYDAYREKEGVSMNPYDTWYRTNLALRDALDSYFNAHIHMLDQYPDLQKRCRIQYRTGAMIQKTRVLTVLSGLRWIARNGAPENQTTLTEAE